MEIFFNTETLFYFHHRSVKLWSSKLQKNDCYVIFPTFTQRASHMRT